MKSSLTFSKFDATLDTDVCDRYNNAELTLTLRLGFRQINPANGSIHGTYHDYGDPSDPTNQARQINKWSNASWGAWKKNFVKSAQRFWHGKFWLFNDSGNFAFTDRGVTYYPNVWCRFKLEGRDASQGNNHHTIDVVRLHWSESFFGSHATLYDSKDTHRNIKAYTSQNKPVYQRAHVHEVGHLLGLDHVDVGKPHCQASGDTNATACYGVADVDKKAVMGSGMQLRIENAYPWREALRYFALDDVITEMSNPLSLLVGRRKLSAPVSSLFSVWPAETKRHYPRTMAELQAGQKITKRPKRG